MGKGRDGHAGKDLIVKVPCGTLVWRLGSTRSAEVSDGEKNEQSTPLKLSTGKRPILRYAGSERAMEINLEAEAAEPTAVYLHQKGGVIADLTRHRQQICLMKSGRGGFGDRNLGTPPRQGAGVAPARE